MFKHIIAYLGWVVLSFFGTACASLTQAQIAGAGSSLANATLQSFKQHYKTEQQLDVTYQSVGSGEGIRRLVANSIDFSVSDVPLNAYEQSAMGLVQWPLFFSGISPVVNLPGVNVGELRLDGEVLAAIFLGRITVWNAPALQALNPGLALPPMPIVFIHRDDSSGTTFALTRYLTQVSSAWAHALGIGSRLIWPVGSGAQGGDGVARVVAKTPGSISYLEFSNAEKHGLAMPKLHTVGGIFVSPSLEMFQATLNTAIWQLPGFYQPFLTSDSPQAWPLVTTSYALVPRHP